MRPRGSPGAMTPRHEPSAGAINAMLLTLFLAGALCLLLCKDAALPAFLTGEDAANYAMAFVLCAELMLCMSPLALLLQPPLMFLLGAACCKAARRLLSLESAAEIGARLLPLLFVPLCFLLGGRGIWNALLLIRALRTDRNGLGRSVKYTCLLAILGLAALWLLLRSLRYS